MGKIYTGEREKEKQYTIPRNWKMEIQQQPPPGDKKQEIKREMRKGWKEQYHQKIKTTREKNIPKEKEKLKENNYQPRDIPENQLKKQETKNQGRKETI